jgi:hypothetical protein
MEPPSPGAFLTDWDRRHVRPATRWLPGYVNGENDVGAMMRVS